MYGRPTNQQLRLCLWNPTFHYRENQCLRTLENKRAIGLAKKKITSRHHLANASEYFGVGPWRNSRSIGLIFSGSSPILSY